MENLSQMDLLKNRLRKFHQNRLCPLKIYSQKRANKDFPVLFSFKLLLIYRYTFKAFPNKIRPGNELAEA